MTLLDVLILIFQALYFLKLQQTFGELQSIQINFSENITGILLIGGHLLVQQKVDYVQYLFECGQIFLTMLK